MLDARFYYRPSNKFAWARAPVLFFGAVLLAATSAILLAWLFEQHWYLIILVPFLVAAVIGAALAGLVGLCHFRNRWLAMVLGAITGAAGYLGYYYLSIVVLTGLWMNPINLPAIVNFRMQTDVTLRAAGGPDKDNKKPVPFMNWFAFAMEAAACVGIPASLVFLRARRAYCEELKQWFAQDTKQVPGGYGEAIRDAMTDQSLNQLLPTIPPAASSQGCDTLTLEYVVPPDGSPTDYPIYLSIHRQAKSLRRLLPQVQLTPDEIVSLLPLFSKATELLATKDREIGHKVEELQQQRAAETLSRYSAHAAATITPVPEPYRQLLQDKSYKWKVNLVGLIPLAFILVGIGVISLGGWLLSVENVLQNPGRLGPGVALIALGIMGLCLGMYGALKLMGVLEMMWINRRFRQIIARRRGVPAWVLEPTSELVSLTPREAFLKITLTMTSDVLFMKLDRSDSTLYLIGDSNDYVIPTDSILEIEPAMFYHSSDQYQINELWYTRLLVSFGNDVRELLIGQAHLTFWPSTNKTRRRSTELLCQRLASLKAGY